VQLRTYTSLWSVEKRLYKFYDITLPYAVSVKQVVVFVATCAPWLIFVNAVGISPGNPYGFMAWFTPPILLTYAATRPVAEGKKFFEYLSSQARYWLSGRTYARLAPQSHERSVEIRINPWVRATR